MRRLPLSLLAACLLAGSPVMAESPAASTPRYITVSANADVDATPDQAELSFELVSENPDLNTAKTKNDQLVERMLTVAREFNIPREKVATSGVYVQPEYDYKPDAPRKLRGYRVSRSMQMTIQPLDVSEKVLTKLVSAGVDHVGGVQFTLANPDEVEAKAREKAIAKAKAKAESITASLGVKLGRVLSIQESGGYHKQPPMPMLRAQAMSVDASPPALPGQVQISQSVTLTFEIQ